MSTRDSKTRPPTAPDPSLEEWRPRQIGPYTILKVLGEGGMGTVYLAEQLTPIRRLVALKLIKLGQDTKEVLARFDQERQALSLMNHANIAKVFDAGANDDGRPYFVMEYVDGIRISDYCDGKELSIQDRLRLFLEVCAGIQHAHQKGIIHRDLKPSNILVADVDGRSVPKIIDFGLAQATEQRLTDQTLLTRQGQWIGTPEYMSPEQAGRGASAVDTRSDIYSLGTVLYELMTGHLPFDSVVLREAGLLEIQRTIQEVEPPKPSTRIGAQSDFDSELAKRRAMDPLSLRKRLRGDLDWIIMRAIEKEPSRRYASAGEFAADIDRHLSHKPALAGPPSWVYRTTKFLRRYRIQVAAVAAVVIALIGGLIASVLQYQRAETNRITAEKSAEHAKAQELLAREQEAAASEAARIAQQRKNEAERSAREAYEASKRATASLERFNLLAGVARFEKLLQQEELLWPAWPQNLEAFRSWNLEFNRIESQRFDIERAISDIDARMAESYRIYGEQLHELTKKYDRFTNPPRENVLNSIRSAIGSLRQSQERAWFETFEQVRTDEFLRETLVKLLLDIDRKGSTARARIRDRLRWARKIEKISIEDHETAWRAASIRVGRARWYRGFSLRPQIGLVPLGPDPDTQLEEFVHLASHDPALPLPKRNTETGALELQDGHGVIFVLLPPRAGPDRKLATPIFIGKHEITQGQWFRMTEMQPSVFNEETQGIGERANQHPVEYVNYYESLSLLARHGFRLPSEGEWEHAARGVRGRGRRSAPPVSPVSTMSNFDDVTDGWTYTAPVGSFTPNGFGLFDVYGNVSEWCASDAPESGRAPVLGGAFNDPLVRRLESGNRRSDRIGIRAVRDLLN
ncbi:MAG: protein kinase [Planctomycetes bacterium]|nr:protein kinase [Planctomycetota bacterium]MCB9916976.1 protein kinase [Planctomycetota bacterium]